jgi:hypothetical protein
VTEKIVGTLHDVMGHSFDTLYDLTFTEERMIAALVRSPSDTPAAFSPFSFLVGDWFTKNKRQQDQLKISEERRKQSSELTLDELLSINPQNLGVRYSDISSIEIDHGLLDYHLKIFLNRPSARKPAIVFTLKKNQVSEAHQILSLVQPYLATKY